MGTYGVRPALRAQLTLARVEEVCRLHFDGGARAGDSVVVKYGAIDELKVRPNKTELIVELRMNPKVDPAVAGETVRRYNRFLEELTGYTAKERAKRAQRAARAAG